MNSLVAVDIGNSAIKFGQFGTESMPALPAPNRVWDLRYQAEESLFGAVESSGIRDSFLKSLDSGRRTWLVSSVHRSREHDLAEWIAKNRPGDCYQVLSYRDVPLAVDVEFPERVGFDRLATSVAADRIRPSGVPAIVVDAGTALKVHAVTARGAFVGGAIFPGYRLAGRALAAQTDLLPEVGVSSQDQPPVALGRDTERAIRSGLYWGFAGAARELVARISNELEGTPAILVSGGDAQGLVSSLGPTARFVPDLCLIGIAIIGAKLLRGTPSRSGEAVS